MSHQTIQPTLPPPFRMVVERCSERTIFGDLLSGGVNIGDEIVFYPSGKRGRVAAVSSAAVFTLGEALQLPPHQVAARVDQLQPLVGTRLRAEILRGKMPEAEKSYTLRYGNKLVDLTCEQAGEDGSCVFKLEASMVFDTAVTLPEQCGFELFAGGVQLCRGRILEDLPDSEYDKKNIRLNVGGISHTEREQLTGHHGLVVWMTGLSGSGKSTIAQIVERNLLSEGTPAYLMDGDKLRKGLASDLGFSDSDRDENQRRVAEVAALFRDAGLVVLVATISPFAKHRMLAREKAGGDFMEVYVKADYATCQERDPKQLYKKANAGDIKNFTGKGSGYEVPENPELLLDTLTLSAEEAAVQLLEAIHRHLGMDSIEYII